MMKKCSVANGYVYAMVPAKTITFGSDNIRSITILLVLLVCVVAVIISIFEFGKLQNAIYITVDWMKGLINTVKTMINAVSEAGEQVSTSSQNVGMVVDEVNTKIGQIHENIQNENMEIASCNRPMEDHSDNIKDVVEQVLSLSGRKRKE